MLYRSARFPRNLSTRFPGGSAKSPRTLARCSIRNLRSIMDCSPAYLRLRVPSKIFRVSSSAKLTITSKVYHAPRYTLRVSPPGIADTGTNSFPQTPRRPALNLITLRHSRLHLRRPEHPSSPAPPACVATGSSGAAFHPSPTHICSAPKSAPESTAPSGSHVAHASFPTESRPFAASIFAGRCSVPSSYSPHPRSADAGRHTPAAPTHKTYATHRRHRGGPSLPAARRARKK